MLPPRLAANVAWLFAQHPWSDRFAAAREAGFAAVEFPWPEDPDGTAAAVDASGATVALVNAPAGDLAAGERGWPNDPGRVDEWRAAFAEGLAFASDVRARSVNVLVGNAVDGLQRSEQLACLEQNLRWALLRASLNGVRVVTELLNRPENPAYLLATVEEARPFIDRLAPLGWRLQLDTHHLAMTGPDVPAAIATAGPWIGHVQVADWPGRHEPGSGMLDWDAVAGALSGAGYEGFIGLEYRPAGDTREGLSWVAGSPLPSR